ncbi:uncharacterized protein LOC110870445 [Helianthus annuus]|uniref:uncharacterized protein LOC110870445 n=1 Tax=Helianthus annuus TaxID=4232 RepID=UPI000B8F9560|nr:uncharacterized protein LOC110870445 [Helianthus annuus]
MNFLSVNLRGVRDQRKIDWIRGLKTSHGAQFLAIQETKLGGMSQFLVGKFWGRSRFESASVDVVGRSGGLISMWDPYVFECTEVIKGQRFVVVQGNLKHTGEVLNIANIYAYNDPIERRALWEELVILKQSLQGMWVFGGDFNDVREPGERFNSEFVALNAAFFNWFIETADLMEFQMGGRKYTYHLDNGVHKSKLDRYLVCRDFYNKWSGASVVTLSNMVSDHCPILMSVVPQDFGLIPTRIFNSWLVMPGIMEFVKQSLESFSFHGAADLGLAVKLKWIKFKLKERVKSVKAEKELVYNEKMAMLENLELQAEERTLSSSELENRAECKKFIMEMDRVKVMDMKQRSRVKWAVDGDENTAFFHNILNANQSSSRINGLMTNGIWVTDPPLIKDSIYSFFAQKFLEPASTRPGLKCPFLKQISAADGEMLAAPF